MSEYDERVPDEQVPDEPVPDLQVPDEQVPDEQVPERSGDGVTDPAVAAALERLEGLAERPVSQHAEVYEDVHQALQQSLAEAQGERPER